VSESSLTLARTVRMSDDMSPAEQARAARWAADWLDQAYVDQVHETSADDLRKIANFIEWYEARPSRNHANSIDPPETVESLRAERDEALTNARTWEDLVDGWRDRAIELPGDVREAEVIIARLRATHDKQIKDMKAKWLKDARERFTDLFLAKNPLPSSEAGRGRCSRED